jgi:hypothetical protein
LNYFWEILHESTDLGIGGDHESKPEQLEGLITDNNSNTIEISVPNNTGAYRLFIYVFDNDKKVATANIPFYVN